MKKPFPVFLLWLLFIGFASVSFPVGVSALDLSKTATLKSGSPAVGLYYENFSATTVNDAGTPGSQNISYVKKAAAAPVKIVAWSKLGASGIQGSNVMALAEDFEARNPGYKVLAGINGDYYDPPTKTPVNALVQNGDVVKPTNFSLPRYFSLGFADSGTAFITSKTNVLESQYCLSIYDVAKTRIQRETALNGINVFPSVGKTAIYYQSSYPYAVSGARYFRIDHLDVSLNYGSLLLKGQVTGEAANTAALDGQLVIVTYDEKIIALLETNPYVRVQKNLKGDNNGYDNIIGVGSQTLKDDAVLGFEEIGDQSVSFASTRAPRSAIGFTAEGDFVMAAIDGRQTGMSGADLREEAFVMQSLGCTSAFNFDGGGSTQLMVRENDQFVMLNSPSETYRNNANGVLLVQSDVDVSVALTNFTAAGVDVEYELTASSGVTVTDVNVFLNEQKTEVSGTLFSLDGLINSGINYLSFEVTYQKNDATLTRTFLSKRINLANYGFAETPVKVKPSGFTVEFFKDETLNGFSAIVNFDDPDATFHKLYLVHDGIKEIAIKDYRGYVCDFMNVSDPTDFSFEIEFYYRLNTINPVSETYPEIFAYRYESEPEPEPEPEPEKAGCFGNGTITTWVYLFSLLGAVVWWRKRGQN